MFETFGFESFTPVQASLALGLVLGVIYGMLAQRSRFCLRRGLTGRWHDCLPALGTWMMALATAIAGTRLAVGAELISFSDHRFLSSDLPLLAILFGGSLFGIGMALSGGCVSRLAVLAGTGNLRSFLVIIVLAIAAHATMKGALAPLRNVLGDASVNTGGSVSLTALPGGEFWIWAVVLAAGLFALRSRAPASHLAMAAAIGLLVPAGWIGTGFILLDEFDPLPLQSLGFTGSTADTLFWTVAATAITAGFSTGLMAGTVLGSLVSAALSSEFHWRSLNGPAETGRYMTGGVLMGIGGTLAGGCTVGAGLSGVSTGGFSAILALVTMVVSARIAGRLLADDSPGAGRSAVAG